MRHRGPDTSGTWVAEDASVGLGHTRLAIIDLEHGQQPMHSEDGTVHAVVNGMLYDYDELRAMLERKGCIFVSKCDSELVVPLWSMGLLLG